MLLSDILYIYKSVQKERKDIKNYVTTNVRTDYRERNKYRVPILMALTDKMSLDNSTLDFPLRMPIYIPNFGRRGLGNYLIM